MGLGFIRLGSPKTKAFGWQGGFMNLGFRKATGFGGEGWHLGGCRVYLNPNSR